MNERGEKFGMASEQPSKDAPREPLVIDRQDETMIQFPNVNASPPSMPSSFKTSAPR